MTRIIKIIAAVLILFYLVLQLFSSGIQKKERRTAPEKFIVMITAPAQRLAAAGVGAVRNLVGHYFTLSGTARLNEQLSAERDELKGKLVRMKELEDENIRLRNLLEFGHSQKLRLLGAGRTVPGPSPYERVARIRRGKSQGIEQGMAVIHPKGVVGQILEAAAETSDILLLVDAASAIDVIDQRSRSRGILKGNTFNELRFEFVPKGEDIQVGDEVVSSGLDGVYPKGLPVGIVTSVGKGKTQLFLDATVRPYVDFGKLDEVAVVLK